MNNNTDKDTLYFLKSSVRLEPHIWGWYAWPQLISPLTASLNILNRHLKLMHSFLEMPEIHKMAAKDPALMGGSFIDLDDSRVSAIQSLYDLTKIQCEGLLLLAEAILSCDELLRKKADGHSLESLYKEVPEVLRGCIELVYDANHHPAMRFIERLFYDKYYDESHQGIILCDTIEDYRPFVLSTPRLVEKNELNLPFSFSDPRVDILAELRFKPKTADEIEQLLQLNEEQFKQLQTSLTSLPPLNKEARNYQGEGVRVKYFGHACVLLETNETSILIDPVLSYEFPTTIERYTLNDLPDKIDYVLFTHIHDDHVLFETLLQIRYKVKHFVFPGNNKGFLLDPSLKLILEKTGFKNLMILDEFESLNLLGGQITGLPFFGEHCDLNIQTKMAYFVKLKETTFLFAADSNNLENTLYQTIFQKVGKADVLFIGMECVGAPLTWLYGPLMTDKVQHSKNQSRRLSGSDFAKAWDIVKLAKAKEVYVYAMGHEPWLNYIMALDYSKSVQYAESDKLVEICNQQGIASERLYLKKEWIF